MRTNSSKHSSFIMNASDGNKAKLAVQLPQLQKNDTNRRLSLQQQIQEQRRLSVKFVTTNKDRRFTMDQKAQQYLETLRQTGLARKKEIEQLKLQSLQTQGNEKNYIYKVRNANDSIGRDEYIFPNQSMFLKYDVKLIGCPKILNLRYDINDENIALACDNGYVSIFDDLKGSHQRDLVDLGEKSSPATSVRWFPLSIQATYLLSTYQNGAIIMYDTSNGQIREKYESGVQSGFSNSYMKDIQSCDFDSLGQKFVTGGYDQEIRIYDVSTKKVSLLNGGKIPKHNNRIYATQFINKDCNTLMSAGWDNTILFWDVRVGTPVNFIHGPEICGDSLDCKGNEILAGSWRSENQLQLFDYRTMSLLRNISWDKLSGNSKEKNYIYAAKFSKMNDSYILAGSTGSQELRLFDKTQNCKLIDCMKDKWDKGIYSIDFACSKNQAIYGCGDSSWGQIHFI